MSKHRPSSLSAIAISELPLMQAIHHFLEKDLLYRHQARQCLFWLCEMLYLSGTIKNKLEYLGTLKLSAIQRSKLALLETHPLYDKFTDPYLTRKFDEMLGDFILKIQAQIPELKTLKKQRKFLQEQRKISNTIWHLKLDLPSQTYMVWQLNESLSNLYQILSTLYHLSNYDIALNHASIDLLKYTLLNQKLANQLQHQIAFIPAQNLFNNSCYSSFTGLSYLIEEMNQLLSGIIDARRYTDDFDISFNPYQHFPFVRSYLNKIKFSKNEYDRITRQFVTAIHHLERHLPTESLYHISDTRNFDLTPTAYQEAPNELTNAVLFLNEIISFLLESWLQDKTSKQRLEIHYTLIYSAGSINDKLTQLIRFDLDPETHKKLQTLISSSLMDNPATPLNIDLFHQMMVPFIEKIQEEQPTLQSPAEQSTFAMQEISRSISSYTFYSKKPIDKEEGLVLYQALSDSYHIIKKIHYLYHHRICDTWEGFDVFDYTIYAPFLAEKLSANQALRPGINASGNYRISFSGQTWILEEMNKILKIVHDTEKDGPKEKHISMPMDLYVALRDTQPQPLDAMNLPFDLYYHLNEQLDAIKIPSERKEQLKKQFIQSINAIHGFQIVCEIHELPIIEPLA